MRRATNLQKEISSNRQRQEADDDGDDEDKRNETTTLFEALYYYNNASLTPTISTFATPVQDSSSIEKTLTGSTFKKYCYKLNYTLVDTNQAEENLLAKMEESDIFAFDCESTSLDRHHKLSVMNICLQDGTVYLLDVKKLDGISTRLKSILEKNNIKKVMFDCRSDADCLYHQYDVQLSGIIDMQLMQYLIQYPNKEAANHLPSYVKTIEQYFGGEIKSNHQSLRIQDQLLWDHRPLEKELLSYSTHEIALFHSLYKKLKLFQPQQAYIESTSEKYANTRRKRATYDRSDKYSSHGFMPLDVLTKAQHGNVKCCKCDIRLHQSQYYSRDRRIGQPKCVVCRKIR